MSDCQFRWNLFCPTVIDLIESKEALPKHMFCWFMTTVQQKWVQASIGWLTAQYTFHCALSQEEEIAYGAQTNYTMRAPAQLLFNVHVLPCRPSQTFPAKKIPNLNTGGIMLTSLMSFLLNHFFHHFPYCLPWVKEVYLAPHQRHMKVIQAILPGLFKGKKLSAAIPKY